MSPTWFPPLQKNNVLGVSVNVNIVVAADTMSVVTQRRAMVPRRQFPEENVRTVSAYDCPGGPAVQMAQ